jgi:hypothetical protein
MALLAVASLAGCIRSWSEVHIVEQGFSGPVVIVYGVAGAQPLAKDPGGSPLFVVPQSGVLLVADPSPGSGAVNATYYETTADGAQRKIPSNTGSPDEFQVFASVAGSTGNSGSDATYWQAYVVGRPSQWPNAASDRQSLIEQVVGKVRARRE